MHAAFHAYSSVNCHWASGVRFNIVPLNLYYLVNVCSLLFSYYNDLFRINRGHVSRGQMRQCFARNGILLSDEEFYALEQRFNDDLGFNYAWFIKDIMSYKVEAPLVILTYFLINYRSNIDGEMYIFLV